MKLKDDDATTVSKPEFIFHDVWRIAAESSEGKAGKNTPNEQQSSESTLQEEATATLRTQAEDMFDAIANQLVSEDRPTSSTLPTYSVSSAKLEYIMFKQIASIPALVE